MDSTAVDPRPPPLSIDTMHVVHPRAAGLDVRRFERYNVLSSGRPVSQIIA